MEARIRLEFVALNNVNPFFVQELAIVPCLTGKLTSENVMF